MTALSGRRKIAPAGINRDLKIKDPGQFGLGLLSNFSSEQEKIRKIILPSNKIFSLPFDETYESRKKNKILQTSKTFLFSFQKN